MVGHCIIYTVIMIVFIHHLEGKNRQAHDYGVCIMNGLCQISSDVNIISRCLTAIGRLAQSLLS